MVGIDKEKLWGENPDQQQQQKSEPENPQAGGEEEEEQISFLSDPKKDKIFGYNHFKHNGNIIQQIWFRDPTIPHRGWKQAK